MRCESRCSSFNPLEPDRFSSPAMKHSSPRLQQRNEPINPRQGMNFYHRHYILTMIVPRCLHECPTDNVIMLLLSHNHAPTPGSLIYMPWIIKTWLRPIDPKERPSRNMMPYTIPSDPPPPINSQHASPFPQHPTVESLALQLRTHFVTRYPEYHTTSILLGYQR